MKTTTHHQQCVAQKSHGNRLRGVCQDGELRLVVPGDQQQMQEVLSM